MKNEVSKIQNFVRSFGRGRPPRLYRRDKVSIDNLDRG